MSTSEKPPRTIAVQGLGVSYRGGLLASTKHTVQALRGLDLAASRGEVIGILGPNGSGKSTLLGVLAGTRRPSSGAVSVLGTHPTDRALVQRVGYQPEGPLPFPSLSAQTFLDYLGDVMGLPHHEVRQRRAHWLDRLDLAFAATRKLGSFSTGMARRLTLAAALLPNPEVLLLDEPTSGLDPDGSLTMMEVVREQAAAGSTVLMASHNLEEVEQTCDRVYVLQRGVRRAEGTLDDLLGGEDHNFVVRGLDSDGLREVCCAIERAGAEVVRVGREREHLYALFRRLRG